MKIFKYTTLACALLMSSCSTSFLDVEPIGQVGTEQIFTDATGMHDALMGSYSLTAKFFQSEYSIYGDLRADDVSRLSNSTITTLVNEYNYNYDQESTGAPLNLWANGYEAINNINNVINAADAIRASHNTDVNTINSIEAQAHILRGLMFFALSNIYAQHYTYTADASHLGIPIPLSTPKPGEKLGRATMKDTYAQIIADLQFGIDANTTKQSERIYASTEAAKALLSRVYLYMGDYDNAIKYATEIITSSKYKLANAEDYLDMFIGTAQRTDFSTINNEVIWQFNLTTKQESSFLNVFYYGYGTSYSGVATPAYVDLFEKADIRKSMLQLDPKTGAYISLKYAKKNEVIVANMPITFKVVRLSEMLLNRAEAYCHKQQYDLAAEDLRIIRARAYNTSISSIIVSYTSAADLIAQIKMERRKELGFEGQRIYDIMRYKESLDRGTACTSSVCTVSYPNDIFILPIPKRELDANELIKPNPTVNN